MRTMDGRMYYMAKGILHKIPRARLLPLHLVSTSEYHIGHGASDSVKQLK